ncbi:MAG: acetyl-CoA carboxylase biotin carboxyl carrier protein [Betaproteobacteria bacterium]|nr:acetyl-CoA carboxylase biotin carboxyl carrier protein [Betaproteobacteria bacterium]
MSLPCKPQRGAYRLDADRAAYDGRYRSGWPVDKHRANDRLSEAKLMGHTVKSPMVGTFYRASQPGADPFVQIGSKVSEHDVLCLIEAMKLLNEIEAGQAGTVTQILVENGQPVEYGQPLFVIE